MDYTPWLIRKTERDFFNVILEYVVQINGEINILEKEVDCFLQKDFQQCIERSEKLFTKSKDTIKMRKKLLRSLETGNITPDHRGYMANLIYSLADIAGYIDSASAKLSFKQIDVDKIMAGDIKDITKDVSKMIGLLQEAISLLNKNLEKVIIKTEQISELEEKIDLMKRRLAKRIIEKIQNNPTDQYILLEIVRALDSISDMIDKAGHRVEVIAMEHLP